MSKIRFLYPKVFKNNCAQKFCLNTQKFVTFVVFIYDMKLYFVHLNDLYVSNHPKFLSGYSMMNVVEEKIITFQFVNKIFGFYFSTSETTVTCVDKFT